MNATLTSPELTKADRCDRCGAAARVRATLPSGAELLFASITPMSTPRSWRPCRRCWSSAARSRISHRGFTPGKHH